MDRRTFLEMTLAAPALGQAATGRTPAKAPTPTPVPVAAPVGVAWTQWGGPSRNFQTVATGIKDVWPAGGPRVVWKRVLGDGYSAPVVENGVLYTMYGRSREEVVVAANAETGQTLWEAASPMTFVSDAGAEMGNGPYASPLVAGDRLITAGVAGKLQCFDKRTGRVLWTQELWERHQGSRLMYGYASSPIAFRDMVIVPVGGSGKSIMAFKVADGSVAWAKLDFGNVYSSPVLINVSGLEQLAVLMDGAILAVNPHNGDEQWEVPFKANYSIAIATPLYGPDDNLLFISSEYDGGAKVIELQRNGLETKATELWANNRFRLHHGNAMRIAEAIYFSSGGKGSQPILSAVEARSGKILWQERSIGKATFVRADGKVITLDGDGTLMIAYPSPLGFKIAAKAPVLGSLAWTPPVLVGTRLYLRNRSTLMAVDLG
jgi:outer membrane protein assembly factor BamB